MEKLEARTENIPETQALENALRIFARMIARACIKEIASDAQVLNELISERATLSNKITKAEQQTGKGLTLTTTEAAELLRVGRTTIYESIRRRQIPSIRFGRRILIPRAALTKVLNEASN